MTKHRSIFLEALGQAAIDRDHKVVWFTLEDLGSLMRRHRIDDTGARAIDEFSREWNDRAAPFARVKAAAQTRAKATRKGKTTPARDTRMPAISEALH